MELNTLMDVDLVAVESEDEVTVMLELTAPAQASDVPRAPAAIQVVLDRSGSMAGERLEAACVALAELVERLDPADRLGVVAFDDEVEVVIPAGPVLDKAAARAAVLRIAPRGSTNLSSGLLRGLRRRSARRWPAARRSCCSATGTRTSASRAPRRWRPLRRVRGGTA